MNKIYIIAVLFLIILCLIYYFSPTISKFESGTDALVCQSPAAISAAKNYYDNIGEYHGTFVMDPISSVQVDGSNCDVKYQNIPTPTSRRNDSGVDARRFTYTRGTEGWKVAVQGGWKSGTTNM